MKEANGSPLLSVLPQGPFSVQQIHGASSVQHFIQVVSQLTSHFPLSKYICLTGYFVQALFLSTCECMAIEK